TWVSSSSLYYTINVSSAGRPVANDGTAVYCDNGSLVILQGDQSRRIVPENYDQATDAVIDAATQVVVYSVTHNTGTNGVVNLSRDGPRSLHIVPVAGGAPRTLSEEGYSPSISDDGQLILHMRRVGGTPQVWVMNGDGSSGRQLTSDAAGIASAALSGDGSVAYAITFGGEVIRIATDSGEITEVVPRTPWLENEQAIAPDRFSF